MENNDQEAESITTTTTNNNSSCSACKYQRKRCKPDCILRKHFPSTKYNEFKNVQKIFGIANIMKMIRSANNSSEDEREIVESMFWEAEAWAKSPFRGPKGEHVQELNELKSKCQILEAMLGIRTGTNVNVNTNVMSPNYPNNADIYMDAFASGFTNVTRNGSLVVHQRFVQHGSNNNGLVNNQEMMENGNWRESRRNGIEQWREQQGMGNFGPMSLGHTPFVSGTERNRADATNQDFGSKKTN